MGAICVGAEHLREVLEIKPVLEVRPRDELQRPVQHQETSVREALVFERGDEGAELDDEPHDIAVARVGLEATLELAEHQREMVECLALLHVAFALLHAEDARANDERNADTKVDLRKPAINKDGGAGILRRGGHFRDTVAAVAFHERIPHRACEAECRAEVILPKLLSNGEGVLSYPDEQVRIPLKARYVGLPHSSSQREMTASVWSA